MLAKSLFGTPQLCPFLTERGELRHLYRFYRRATIGISGVRRLVGAFRIGYHAIA